MFMNNTLQLGSLKYINKVWTPQHNDQPTNQDSIKCLTYNVWFEQHNFQLRAIELFKIISESNADYVCLQEVTKEFQLLIKQDTFIQSNYYMTSNFIDGYGTLILQKPRPKLVVQVPFKSNMGRNLLYTVSQVGQHEIVVGTVHLESMNYPQYRYDQLQICYNAFKQYSNVVLMGDFNYDGKENEVNLSKDYIDAWPTLHTTPGLTMKLSSHFYAWRPDRVIIKKDGKIQLKDIQIVGDYDLEMYQGKETHIDEIRTPSDHMGLLSSILLQ